MGARERAGLREKRCHTTFPGSSPRRLDWAMGAEIQLLALDPARGDHPRARMERSVIFGKTPMERQHGARCWFLAVQRGDGAYAQCGCISETAWRRRIPATNDTT